MKINVDYVFTKELTTDQEGRVQSLMDAFADLYTAIQDDIQDTAAASLILQGALLLQNFCASCIEAEEQICDC